jgi:hypothetical protein
MPSGKSSSDRGASLLEVAISLGLVMLGLLGVYSAYTASVRATSHGQRVTQATARAEKHLEILRNAPTAAITCLAMNSPVDVCVTQCCQALVDGGVTCVPGADGGVVELCQLLPSPYTDINGITYTHDQPTVTVAPTSVGRVKYLYDVKVRVFCVIAGEKMGSGDIREVILTSSVYKP